MAARALLPSSELEAFESIWRICFCWGFFTAEKKEYETLTQRTLPQEKDFFSLAESAGIANRG